MAEFVMKRMVSQAGLDSDFEIESAATSTEEIGNPVYPPVKTLLTENGIDCSQKRARQITQADYDHFDLIILMDHYNLRTLKYVIPADLKSKVHLLLDYTDTPGDIADPWYTRDFNLTWRQINLGCKKLLLSCRTSVSCVANVS